MEKFDVIIVGAGLAGLAAAYTLADSGLEILVLERGDYAGAKNITGGRLYLNPVRELFPALWPRAPWERPIVREGVTLMAPERTLSFNYAGNELRREPHQSYSILRSRFDRWLADEVEGRGAMILTKTKVQNLVREGGRVAGVVAGGDELRADTVILCDGVLSLLAEKAGLRAPDAPHHYALGVKEVIALEPGVINDRFRLEDGEGAAQLFVGSVTAGRFGGGFLYTNHDSISLGIVVGLGTGGWQSYVPSLLEAFKAHPDIAPLIRDGQGVEYAAHVIPEGGLVGRRRLWGDGVLVAGDAAGFTLNLGFTVRGMEYALASGYLAAQTYLKAREQGRFDAETLSLYGKLLEESFVLKDFQTFRANFQVLTNPRLFDYYPRLLGDMMRDVYHVPVGPKDRLFHVFKKHLGWRDIPSILKDLRDLMKI